METSDAATVRLLLGIAGISPNDEERAEMTRFYPELRAALDGLHRVAPARYAAPALVFRAGGTFADWGSGL